MDDHFSLAESRQDLWNCKRKSLPGADGISYLALTNLDPSILDGLLKTYNEARSSGSILTAWRSSLVRILKSEKPSHLLDSYPTTPLTLSVGKLMEEMAYWRLKRHLEHLAVLPEEMSGFRHQRCIADAVMDLSSPEETRARQRTIPAVFLDTHRVFHALLRAMVLNQLNRSEVRGRFIISKASSEVGVCRLDFRASLALPAPLYKPYLKAL